MDAAKTNDPSIIVDETLYRFFQFMTVDLIKFEHPRLYAWMRLLGAINADARLTLEETFAPEVPKSIFSGDYWDRAPAAFVRGYQNFRLDQAHDFVLQDPGLNPNLTEDQRVELRQLGVELFGFSDGGFIIFALLLWLYEKKHPDRDVTIEQLYSWELPYHQPPPLCIEPTGETGIPISDHIASRAYTTRISTKTGEPAKRSATLTQVLLRDRDGDLGWLFSLRGAVTFEDKRGSKERPVKATITIAATDGLDVFVKFAGDDQLSFTGSAAAGMKIAIQPEKPSTVAPAIALPDGKGTRLEIGDYSFSLELSKDGFKVKLSLKKSAFVFGGEGDAFMKEVLGSQERRVEFDLGITADQNGVSVDGGGRLSTTLSLNRTIGPVTVKTIQLALVPDGDDKSSELAFSAVASFVVKIKAVTFVVEQIGFTINVGSTSDPPPPDALTMASGLLYVRELGFKPPAGLGITVEGDFVNGGGFLFHDREHDEYAGVLQLDFGPRFTFTAIGLLTTKLPDGREGYTFLIILSLELDPAWRIGPLAISGLGGLFGLRRALDTDALRAGLRNRTLDAVLFPKDPVANAGRLIAALRTVFPPATDRHVAGPILQLSLGVPAFLTAELGLVFEWGASSRRALIGQLHLALPPRVGPKVVEINIDAAGIWDGDAFSLDATIYDSHIACVQISGDVAFRMKSGDSSFFLLSLGGYHPEFNAPANFPKLQRMKVALAETDNFRLVLTGYFALTSNTKQFGADLDFKVGGAGISVEARLSFDALFDKNAGFIIDFDLEVKVKYKGKTFFGVSASGRFTGPEPKRVKGEWTLDLWLFSITRPFEKVLGDDAPPVELPVVDPLPDLVAALKNPQSWSAPLPGSSRMLVSFRNRPGSPEVLIHPLGEIGVRQQLLPLGIELDLYGGGVVTGKRSFSITKAFVGKDELTAPPVVNEQFAAGDFLQLSDDEKLHRKSFEAMPAGVRLQPKALGVRRPGARNGGPGGCLRDRLRGDRRRRGRQRRPPDEAEDARPADPDVRRRVRPGGEVAASRRRGGALRRAGPRLPRRRGALHRREDGRPRPGRHRRDGGPLGGRRAPGAGAPPAGEPAGPRRAAGRPRIPRGGARLSRYRYLPWVREGAAHAYDTPDKQAAVLARPDGKPISAVPIGLLVNDKTRVDVPLRIYGPGDVVGIDPRAVLRTDPLAEHRRLRAELPRVHRVRHPGLPLALHAGRGRHERPAAPVARARRRSAGRGRGPAPDEPGPAAAARRRRERAPGPGRTPGRGRTRRSSSWTRRRRSSRSSPRSPTGTSPAWCARGGSSPRPATSRASCRPSRPAARRGSAARSRRPTRTSSRPPGAATAAGELPVYYHWEFATGAGGDFETLARRLKPRAVGPDVGKRKLRVGKQPFGLPNAGVLQLEGALVAPGELTRPRPPTPSGPRCATSSTQAPASPWSRLPSTAIGSRRAGPSPPTRTRRTGCAS